MELNPTSSWNNGPAPHSDVVMSCRVRLARNVAGYPFVNRATATQCNEVVRTARQVLLSLPDNPMMWVDLNASTARDRRLLVERHLISKNMDESTAPGGCRAVAISENEQFAVMVNEEDHLRMQILSPGLELEAALQRINDLDDTIESKLDYAFSPRWGYLTACPTNVGTGIRYSVMLHLPALKITNEIERVRRAARDLHLAVRGYYGEGSDSAGDFYQISNQITLGKSEAELLEEFQDNIIPQIIDYEHEARRVLADRNPALLDDRTHRALAVLRSARLLGLEEAMKLLSRVRLGVLVKRLEGIELATVNQMFLQVQPAHLQLHTSGQPSADELREARATLVRNTLA